MKDSVRAATLVAKAATWRELRFAMSDPDSHPMADWPDALLWQWNKFAITGAVDSQHPPATAQEAHRLLVEIQLRQMQGVVQELQTNVDALMAESDDELLPVNLRRTLAVCARCGAGDLEHFYTAKRTGKVLCAACHQRQATRSHHNG